METLKTNKIMKNIHVLPTDKPSRLCYLTKKGKEVYKDLRLFEKPMPIILDSENQNIYITSNEEIKEGDWIFDLDINRIVKADNLKVITSKKSQCWYYKKIILTTDQDLIEDGVQAIDDDFLEWFVKNPSCEEVEIGKIALVSDNGTVLYDIKYKIIIPKEEVVDFLGRTTFDLLKQEAIEEEILEQETLDNIEIEEMSNDWETMSQQIKPKQETLEEVAERILHINEVGDEDMILCSTFPNTIKSMVEMAKWQQERSYSEEDILKFSEWISHNDWVYLQSKGYWVNEEAEESEEKFTTKELFNKSKKK